MLKVIELFSGVGAQKEALNKSGIEHEVVAISEIDKYSIKRKIRLSHSVFGRFKIINL